MQDSLDYIIAYGISNKSGELLYKKLNNGQYLIASVTINNIDIYMLKELYECRESITKPAEILSFTLKDKQKTTRLKELINL